MTSRKDNSRPWRVEFACDTAMWGGPIGEWRRFSRAACSTAESAMDAVKQHRKSAFYASRIDHWRVVNRETGETIVVA